MLFVWICALESIVIIIIIIIIITSGDTVTCRLDYVGPDRSLINFLLNDWWVARKFTTKEVLLSRGKL